MLAETIKFTDYNDVEQERVYHFNLSRAELSKIELGYHGGIEGHLKKIIDTGLGRQIIEFFEDLVKDSYGVRTADGAGFEKNEAVYQSFKASGAYQALLENLLDDPEYGLYFVRGVVPAKMREAVEKAEAEKATQNGFRPGAQTLPQSEIDKRDAAAKAQAEAQYAADLAQVQAENQRAQLTEVGQVLDTAHVVPAAPVEAIRPVPEPGQEAFGGFGTNPGLKLAIVETGDTTALPEDPLLPHEPGYDQGLTRRQSRELGLL